MKPNLVELGIGDLLLDLVGEKAAVLGRRLNRSVLLTDRAVLARRRRNVLDEGDGLERNVGALLELLNELQLLRDVCAAHHLERVSLTTIEREYLNDRTEWNV